MLRRMLQIILPVISVMFVGSVLPSASAQSQSDCGTLGVEIELIRIPQPPENSSGYGPVGPGEIDAAKVIGVQAGCAGEAAQLHKGDAIFKIDGSFISANPEDPNFISKLVANAGAQGGAFSVTVGRGGRAGPHSIPTDLKIRPVAPKQSAPMLAALPRPLTPVAAYDWQKPDLRGRWSGVVVGQSIDGGKTPRPTSFGTFYFDGTITGSFPSYVLKAKVVGNNLHGYTGPPVVEIPLEVDQYGTIEGTLTIPNKSGETLSLKFRGMAEREWSDNPAREARSYYASFLDGTGKYASSISMGRVEDIPGTSPVVNGLPAEIISKWPVTLAEHRFYNEVLLYATDRIALYGTSATRPSHIVYDVPDDESLFDTEESQLELESVIVAAINGNPKESAKSGVRMGGFYKDRHYISGFQTSNEVEPFNIRIGQAGPRVDWYVGNDKMAQVAGKPPYSKAAFSALMGEVNQKADKFEQDQIAEREFAKTAAQNGYLTIAQSEAQYEDIRDRARASAAKKYGYVSWPNSTWALAPRTYSREASNPYKSSTVRTVFSGDYVGDEGVRQGILWAYVIAKDARCSANIVNGQSRSYTLIQDTSYFNMGWYVPRMSKNTHTFMVDGRLAGYLRGNRGQSFWDIVPQAQAENMYWFFNKVECGSPEMRQLEENLYRMMAGQRSLQKEKAGSQGTRREKEFYTEGGREFFGLYSIASSTTKLAPFYANGVRTTYRDVIRKYMSADGSYDWSNRRFFKDDNGNTYGFFYRENPYEDNDPFLRVRVVKLNPADIAYIIKVSTDGKVPFSYQAPILRKNPLGHLMWRFDYGIQDLNPDGGVQVFSSE